METAVFRVNGLKTRNLVLGPKTNVFAARRERSAKIVSKGWMKLDLHGIRLKSTGIKCLQCLMSTKIHMGTVRFQRNGMKIHYLVVGWLFSVERKRTGSSVMSASSA